MITFIVGPTATGKTKKALELAFLTHADILSADSRQIYSELPITSGADLPKEFILSSKTVDGYSFHTDEKTDIRIYGIGFLSADQDWSIAHFRDFAEAVLAKTQERKRDLVIVGGSGLYVRSLFLDKQLLHIPPSELIRSQLEQKQLEEIQEFIRQQHPDLEHTLNHSDWNNKRRLIRWIEKRSADLKLTAQPSVFGSEKDHQWITLAFEKVTLEALIRERVKQRLDRGAIQEVQHLLEVYPEQKLPALSTLGVKEIRAYIFDQLTKDELTELWTKKEFQYAKRQITWFNKYQPHI